MKKTKTGSQLERLLPPGIPLKPLKDVFWSGLVTDLLYSLGFLIRYFDRRAALYYTDSVGKTYLIPGAMMPDFAEIIGESQILFFIHALVLLGFIVYYYMYYHRGSKSIYLMRRLPDRWEIHRRSITVPAVAAAAVAAAAFAVLMIYFAIYMLATPDVCIAKGQWTRFWRELL